jgi:hypothetical protein
LLTKNSRFNSSDFSDVTLLIYEYSEDRAGETTRIAAHRFVLAAGSRAFRDYFQPQSKVKAYRRAYDAAEGFMLSLLRSSAATSLKFRSRTSGTKTSLPSLARPM